MKLMIGVKSGDLPGKYIFKSEGRAKGERRESECIAYMESTVVLIFTL